MSSRLSRSEPKFIFVIAILILAAGFLYLRTMIFPQSSVVQPTTIRLSINCPGTDSNEVHKVIADPMQKAIDDMEYSNYRLSSDIGNGSYLLIITLYDTEEGNIAVSKISKAVKRIESNFPMEIIKRGYKIDLQQLKPEECPPIFKMSISFSNTKFKKYSELIQSTLEEEFVAEGNIFYHSSNNLWSKYSSLTITFDEGTDGDIAKSALSKAIKRAEARLQKEISKDSYKINLQDMNKHASINKLDDNAESDIPAPAATLPKDAATATKQAPVSAVK